MRRAARVIVIDRAWRVLLVRHRRDDGSCFWVVPGGGLDAGETYEQAAVRELGEEVGLQLTHVKPLMTRMVELVFGGRPIVQEERLFVARIGEHTPSTAGAGHEEGIQQARWMTLDEVRAITDPVFPENLVELLEGLKH